MKRSVPTLTIFVALLCVGLGALGPDVSAESPRTWKTRVAPEVSEALREKASVPVIVSFAGALANVRSRFATPATMSAARLRVAVSPDAFRSTRTYRAVPAVAGEATADGVRALAQEPGVLRVSLDEEVTAELGEAVPLIRADEAQSQLGVTGDGVVVAVLDTGIDTDHPLLSDDLTFQACFLSTGDCPGGGTTGTSAEDGNGHGTHVSGMITSSGPPTGVAPDAAIEAFKVLQNDGSGTWSNVLAAYDAIIQSHPEVDVINMSLGTSNRYVTGTCEDLLPALTTAVATTRLMGITTFAAAGNSKAKNGLAYPACLEDVVSVGAVYDANVGPQDWGCVDPATAADQVTCFSQSDPQLDLLAPGSRIDSTWLGGTAQNQSGTSMASPAAAGAAALLLESEPELSPAALEARLQETGTPVTDAANGVTTCRVDVYEAIVNDGGPVCASSGPAPPVNDDFTDAIAVTEPLPNLNAVNSLSADTEVAEPSPCGNIAATVWYRYTPTSSASVVADTFASDLNTVLAVYTGSSLNALTLVDCNDDANSNTIKSRLAFQASAGTTYYLQLGGASGDFGTLALRLKRAKTAACEPAAQPTMCVSLGEGPGGSGLLVCDDPSEPAGCTVAVGQQFEIMVQATGIPAGGYIGFQTELFLGGLVWQPKSACLHEVIWPEAGDLCGAGPGGAGQPQHVDYAIAPISVSTFQGALVQLDAHCPSLGMYEVALTAWPSSDFGAAYVDPNFSLAAVATIGQQPFDTDGDSVPDAILDVADAVSIECLEAPTPTPTSTATPTPTPTPCPDLDDDSICDASDPDIDGDSCTNVAEQQAAIGSETSGGRRDPFNPWDYFDPDHDGFVRITDILLVVAHFGHDEGVYPDYSTDFDRSPLAPPGHPWQFGPPDGKIRIVDILRVVASFGHDCGPY